MLLETPLCNFGWQAPDFTLSDPNNKPHRMQDYLQPNGLLIMFICNHCPYVKAIAEQLSTDCQQLQKEGINVLAVMSNDYRNYPEDAPNRMLAFANKHHFSFPYLVDADQTVAKSYDAVCTPDFFGLNRHGQLQYRGRFDNLGIQREGDRIAEMLHAMRDIATSDKGPTEQYASMGCSIKWQ